jgi:hypothetical protein
MINGREIEIPFDTDGTVSVEELRRAAGIPAGRQLILKGSDGSNTVVNPGEQLRLDPRQHFADMPAHTRGD